MTPEPDEVVVREVSLEALNESVSLVIGCILTHEPDEAKRKAAIDVLIECHRRALVAAVPERPRLH